jgi:hypothetical protein
MSVREGLIPSLSDYYDQPRITIAEWVGTAVATLLLLLIVLMLGYDPSSGPLSV